VQSRHHSGAAWGEVPPSPARSAAGQMSSPFNTASWYRPPTDPLPGAVRPPPPESLLPIRRIPPEADQHPGKFGPPWWWLGCHGGAGTSTLAAAIPGGGDGGRYWPVAAPAITRVVLVARTHAYGLGAAQMAARQWASGGLPHHVRLLGMAVVADAPGRLPKPLREFLRLVSGGVPQTWEIPWVEALRFGAPPSQAQLPAPFGELATELHQIVSGGEHA
jgi:hypothetical protein